MTRTTFAFAAALLLLGLHRPAEALCPEISREDIIKHAKTGVGCKYVWGGTCWDPSNKSWKGADCSGYVTKCWQIPAASKYTDCVPHYYTTASFSTGTTHWTHISRNDLQKGDALNYRSGGSGHIVIYYSGDKWGSAQVYEARGTAYGILYRTKSVSSSYKARRRHRLKSSTTPATYPLISITSSIQTISSQNRDLCQREKSKGIFDWWVGQETDLYIQVKNSGTAVAKNVKVKLWVEEPYLKAMKWNIYSDWKAGGGFIVNDTDALQKIPHTNPGKSFELNLAALSIGETKRIKLRARAVRFSYGLMDHPDVRAWVSNVDSFYSKPDFSSKPNNVKGYQKQNGGDLRTYAQTDVLTKEICDKRDNDCDGKVDEENICGGSIPKKDAGTQPGKDTGSSHPKVDKGVAGAEAGAGGTEAGGNPQPFTHAEGCEVAGRSAAGLFSVPCLLSLILLLCARRRG